MIRELVYTSAPKGLKPGSQGFCTVAATKGMPDLVRERVEGLSGYRVAFPSHSAQAGLNPVAWSHLAGNLGGARQHLLSRVGYAGLDFEGRINKIAHHLLLDPADFPPGGPAWLISQQGVMRPDWDGRVGWLPPDRPLPRGDFPPRRCAAWERACGDAGWAGVLVESFLNDPAQPAYLEFSPGRDLLPLLAEAIALLPAERRWDVTFSTYFTGLPPDVPCLWRGVLRDSPEALRARLSPGTLVIPIENAGRAPATSALGYINFARTGTPPLRPSSAPAVAKPESPHAEWGPSADTGVGRTVTPYQVVDADGDEPEQGRKASPYRRDPRKPPPLFRQVGTEHARRWPLAFAVLLVLLAGSGGWWWLRPQAGPTSGGAPLGRAENKSQDEEAKQVPEDPIASSHAGGGQENEKANEPPVAPSPIVDAAPAVGPAPTIQRRGDDDERPVASRKKEAEIRKGGPILNSVHMPLPGVGSEGGDGMLRASRRHGIKEVDLKKIKMKVCFVGEGGQIGQKGRWDPELRKNFVTASAGGLAEFVVKQDDDEGNFVFSVDGLSVNFVASGRTVASNQTSFDEIRKCFLVLEDEGRGDVLCVVWLDEIKLEKFIDLQKIDIIDELGGLGFGAGRSALSIEECRFNVVVFVPLRRGVILKEVRGYGGRAGEKVAVPIGPSPDLVSLDFDAGGKDVKRVSKTLARVIPGEGHGQSKRKRENVSYRLIIQEKVKFRNGFALRNDRVIPVVWDFR